MFISMCEDADASQDGDSLDNYCRCDLSELRLPD
jgi:hypothetical protein